MKRVFTSLTLGIALACSAAFAIDSKSSPRPVPLTRPEMKEYIEDMKVRKPRIPLPELTAEDKEKLGERGGGYEGRLRYHYMPAAEGRGPGAPAAGTPVTGAGAGRQGGRGGGGGFGGFAGGVGRDADPLMSLDYKFTVQLFWIVSRTNNCQYCLGHQESKLLAAGSTEDEIAALDSDWSAFSPKEQAAFAFARKFTYQPHELNDADIETLRKDFTDLQILEMILSMAFNNSINRWKEGVGVPQSQNGGGFGRRPEAGAQAGGGGTPAPARSERSETYLTPTSERYQNRITSVAALLMDKSSGKPTRQTVCERPALESRVDVEAKLAAAAKRSPRLPLTDEAKAREVLPDNWNAGPLPAWVRLLADFPTSAKGRISGIRSAEERGDLTQLLKAQVAWIVARQDRAWYATGQSKQRLKELGQSDDQIYQLDGDWQSFSEKDRAMFTVARHLAATPVVLTDDEVDAAVKLAGPRDVVQLVSYITNRASFDRITEAAGLPVD